ALGSAAEGMLARYERDRKQPAFRLGRSRNAVLSQPHAGRDACVRDGMCMWGCAKRSIYNAAHDLELLKRHPNFEYRPGCIVDEIARDGAGYRVAGRAMNGERCTHAAPRLVIAAGTVASTSLVLPFLGRLGERRRLLNNPGYVFALLLPGRLGQAQDARIFA